MQSGLRLEGVTAQAGDFRLGAAYAYQRRVESGEQVVVGVNRFTQNDSASAPGASVPVLRIDPAAEKQQIARLEAWRKARDAARCQAAIDQLQAAAQGAGNLLPPILAAVEAGATTGEIAGRLRQTFGEYHEAVTV